MYAKIHLKSVKLFKQKRNKKIRTNYGMIGIVKIKKMKPRIFLKKNPQILWIENSEKNSEKK